jgi:hypothetical protein
VIVLTTLAALWVVVYPSFFEAVILTTPLSKLSTSEAAFAGDFNEAIAFASYFNESLVCTVSFRRRRCALTELHNGLFDTTSFHKVTAAFAGDFNGGLICSFVEACAAVRVRGPDSRCDCV